MTTRTTSQRHLVALTGIVASCSLLVAGAAAAKETAKEKKPPLATVDHVDLQRYLGTWFEIASYPQSFQRGCTATTATYALRPDGVIDVTNACRIGSPAGREKVAAGKARVVDDKTNAKLEVSFFPFVWAPYWIIDLGPDYEYAVVGHPSRKYLWILSRTPTLDDATYARILERLRAQGYDTTRLVRTLQPHERR